MLWLKFYDSGLNVLHRKKIYHGDLKPENIMVSNDSYNLKIIDFGYSKDMSKCPDALTNLSKVLNADYFAPEIRNRECST